MKFNNINTQNFQSQAVPEASEIKVNNVSLEPIPFVTLTKNEFKSGPYTIGGSIEVDLEGFIYGSNFSQTATGIANLESIRNVSTKNGYINNINIKCGDTNILQDGVGVLNGLSFDQGPQRNWMNVIPYSMKLTIYETGSIPGPAIAPNSGLASKFNLWENEADSNTTARGISNIQETFSYDFDSSLYFEPYADSVSTVGGKHLKINFTLSVEGATSLNSFNGLYGVKGLNHVLEQRLKHYLGSDFRSEVLFSNFSLPASYQTKPFLQKLGYNIDEMGNKAGIQGELIFLPSSNDNKCLLTMSVDHSNSLDSAEKTITINGKAIGLNNNEGLIDESNITAGVVDGDGLLDRIITSSNSQCIDNAETAIEKLFNTDKIQDNAFFTNIKNQAFMDTSSNHAGGTAEGVGIGKPGHLQAGSLLSEPAASAIGTENNDYMLVSKSLKRDYSNNSIDFSVKYSNKRFRIAGALWAEISVDHEKPATKIIEHVIPGRKYPIVQDIDCTNLESYSISCTAQKEPQQDAYDSISTGADTAIEKMAIRVGCSTWAKVSDTCNYGNGGSYRRTVKYTRHFLES
jgi:hypothetical protein